MNSFFDFFIYEYIILSGSFAQSFTVYLVSDLQYIGIYCNHPLHLFPAYLTDATSTVALVPEQKTHKSLSHNSNHLPLCGLVGSREASNECKTL